jgi:hypothetical protein
MIMNARWSLWVVAVCALGDAAACSSNGIAQGMQGGSCSPGQTCDTGLTCMAGVCVSSQMDSGNPAADSGQSMIDGMACTIHGSNCDPSCQQSCGANPDCTNLCCHDTTTAGVYCLGQCVKQGTLNCNGKCIDPSNDNANCGRCGNTCSQCTDCGAGMCSPVAAPACLNTSCGGSGHPNVICSCPGQCGCNGTAAVCNGGTYTCWCNGPTNVTCTSQSQCCCNTTTGTASCTATGC